MFYVILTCKLFSRVCFHFTFFYQVAFVSDNQHLSSNGWIIINCKPVTKEIKGFLICNIINKECSISWKSVKYQKKAFLSLLCKNIGLHTHLSLSLSLCVSLCLSLCFCLSLSLSLCLSVSLSFCLSVYHLRQTSECALDIRDFKQTLRQRRWERVRTTEINKRSK